jgi:hypothetical protein
LYKKEKTRIWQKTTKQPALGFIVIGTGACKLSEPARAKQAPSSEALQQWTTTGTTDQHQPPPDTTGCGPYVLETGENSLVRAGHVLSKRDRHGRSLTQLNRKKPATTTKERVSREN